MTSVVIHNGNVFHLSAYVSTGTNKSGDAIASVLDFSGKKKAGTETVMDKRWTERNFVEK